jgi:hypothetical protein
LATASIFRAKVEVTMRQAARAKFSDSLDFGEGGKLGQAPDAGLEDDGAAGASILGKSGAANRE